MRAVRISTASLLVLCVVIGNVQSADKCCECDCGYNLKKVYKPVVTFKEEKFTCWDYKTVCKDVPAATTRCCKSCLKQGEVKCSCPGHPKKISVPVAEPYKCKECVRKVPCVTWVVEYKCVKCHKKCAREPRKH